MAELVLAAMTFSALLYALFGGADFGAGMVDLVLGARVRARVDVAIAPVWEANHVWLILLIVLAFVGFPRAYSELSTLLHIPIAVALLGIVARGSAFTFRHYDPAEHNQRAYNLVFHGGSLLTPLCLGLVVAATASGTLTRDLSRGFYAVYIAPWNTLFGWSTGVFMCALFAFEGAALLAAECGSRVRTGAPGAPQAREGTPLPYLRLARRLHGLLLVTAVLVALSAYLEHVPWLPAVFASPASLTAFGLALLAAPAIGLAFERGSPTLVRLATGAQLSGITLGFFAAQFPVLVRIEGADLTFYELAAPASVLAPLCWALGLGLVLIVPALVYLIVVYKRPESLRHE